MIQVSKKKVLSLISLFLIPCLCLTGCWDSIELNDIAIVLATAVDIEEDNLYRSTVQVALPGQMGQSQTSGSGGGSGEEISYIDSDVESTLRGAVAKIQTRMSQKITFSHRRVFVVSEDLAKHGIRDMFDTTARVAQNRLSAYIIVAKGKAYDLLKANPEFERFSGENILYLAEQASGVMSINMRQAAQSMNSLGSDTILAYMQVTKSQLSNNPSDEIEFLGYAQFQDDKMVGTFEGEAAHGLMWLRNQLSPYSTIIEIKDDEHAAINIKNGRVQIKPKLKNEHVEFSIKVDINANLVEDFSRSDISKLEVKDLFNQKLEKHIKDSIESAIKVIQENQADSANLGSLLRRSFPKQWKEKYVKNWYEELSKAKFSIVANANITDDGLVSENISKREEKE